MTHEDLTQPAALHRQAGGMATAPDPAIWMDAAKVAEGPLSDMLDQWSDLPPSHQSSHLIVAQGRQIAPAEIREMLAAR